MLFGEPNETFEQQNVAGLVPRFPCLLRLLAAVIGKPYFADGNGLIDAALDPVEQLLRFRRRR
ncbi:hypothetical protein D3C75_1345460 [compost metagenome]